MLADIQYTWIDRSKHISKKLHTSEFNFITNQIYEIISELENTTEIKLVTTNVIGSLRTYFEEHIVDREHTHDNLLNVNLPTVSDIDNCFDTGFYHYENIGFLWCYKSETDIIIQLRIDFDKNYLYWMREYKNGSWTNWENILRITPKPSLTLQSNGTQFFETVPFVVNIDIENDQEVPWVLDGRVRIMKGNVDYTERWKISTNFKDRELILTPPVVDKNEEFEIYFKGVYDGYLRSVWSDPTLINITNVDLIPPDILYPSQSQSVNSTTPTIMVSRGSCPVDGLEFLGVEISISNDSSNLDPVINPGLLTDTLAWTVPEGLLSNHRYYYIHTRCNWSGVWSTWSRSVFFTSEIIQFIEVPQITSPYNGEVDVNRVFTVVGSPFTYFGPSLHTDTHTHSQFQIATDSSFSNIVLNSDIVNNTTSHTFVAKENFYENTNYYTRVRYQGANLGWTDWSTPSVFKTISAFGYLTTPTNVSPIDGTDTLNTLDQITLYGSEFEVINNEDTHIESELKVYTINRYNEEVIEYTEHSDTPTTTFYIPENTLDENKTYYWSIKYRGDKFEWSDWSVATRFTTVKWEIDKPTILTPTNGQENLLASSFNIELDSFTSSSNDEHLATQYVISKDDKFINIVYDSGEDSVNLLSTTLLNDVNHSTIYYLKVRFKGSNLGWCDWSDIVMFKTMVCKVTTPVINTPINNDDTLETGGLVIETNPFTTEGYITDTHLASRFQISTDISFLSIFIDSGDSLDNLLSYTCGISLRPLTDYYIRVSHKGTTLGWSDWSNTTHIKTIESVIIKPEILSPVTDTTITTPELTITGSTFDATNIADEHTNTRWVISTDVGFSNIVYDEINTDLIEHALPNDLLSVDSGYYIRIAYKGFALGWSDWSTIVHIATPPYFGSIIQPEITSPISDESVSIVDPLNVQVSELELVYNTTALLDNIQIQVATDLTFESIEIDSKLALVVDKLTTKTTQALEIYNTNSQIINILINSKDFTSTNITTIVANELISDKKYYIRVRYKCNELDWSNWCTPVSFTAVMPATTSNTGVYFGGSGRDIMNNLHTNMDGAVIVVGQAESESFGGYDAWIGQLNTDFSITHQKHIGITGNSGNNSFKSVAKDSSGNIYGVGQFGSNTYGYLDIVIIKFDFNFNILGQKICGTSANDNCSDICIDDNDNIYVIGSTIGGTGHVDGIIIKFDTDLNLISQKFIVNPDTNVDITFRSSVIDNNGNILCVGNCTGPSTFGGSSYGMDCCIGIFDTNLSLLSFKHFGTTSGDDDTYSVLIDSLGDIFVLGIGRANTSDSSMTSAVIRKFDSNLSFVSEKHFGITFEATILGATIDNDDNIIAIGYAYNETFSRVSILIKASNDLSTCIIKSTTDFIGNLKNVSVDEFNNIIVVGEYQAIPNEEQYDFLVFKFNSSLDMDGIIGDMNNCEWVNGVVLELTPVNTCTITDFAVIVEEGALDFSNSQFESVDTTFISNVTHF